MDSKPSQLKPSDEGFKFFLLINEQQCGPFDQAAIRQMVKLGTVTKETLCWREGLERWLPLGEVITSFAITFK